MSQELTRAAAHPFVQWINSPATVTQMRNCLPSHFPPARMQRLALTAFRNNEALSSCSWQSIAGCIMSAAQLGLEPHVLGSCYLIPRRGECTLLIGYQGLLELVRRSGQVRSVASRVVYENDTFEITYEQNPPFTHKPDLHRTPADAILGFYTHAVLSSGEHLFEYMSLAEVRAIQSRSGSGNSGPWKTDFAEMGKKTIFRRAAKQLPRSIEFADALAIDDRGESGAAPVYEVTATEQAAPAAPAAPTVRLPAPPPPIAAVSAPADEDYGDAEDPELPL